MYILGAPSEDYDVVKRLLAAKNPDPRFVNEMLPALWEESLRYGVDPVGVVAQSGKETHWGKYDGTVPYFFYNTAGIKVGTATQLAYPDITDGNRLFAHAQFGNWNHGARAQVLHLRAYASAPVPDDEVTHARYYTVFKLSKHLVHFSQLSNNWAGAGYGEEVERLARSLIEIGQ